MLYFHIGLPKTATTFWQYAIFPQVDGIRYVHRARSEADHACCRLLRQYCSAEDGASAALRDAVLRILAETVDTLPETEDVLISDEGISMHPAKFWKARGPSPAQVAQRLRELGAGLRPEQRIRIMIGTRSQDAWLPSRYAESAKNFPEFCQGDFEKRLDGIVRAGRLEGAQAWLEYDKVYSAFVSTFGADDVFVVPIEWLTESPSKALDTVERFLGRRGLAEVYERQKTKSGNIVRMNKLSAGENTWKMREGDGIVSLTPEMRASILSRFETSNGILAEMLG